MNQLFANPVAAMIQGHAAAQGVNDIRRNNALNRLYQEQGAGIASGDPQALNALAQLDPMAALDVRRVNSQERRAERGLQIDEERLGLAKAAAKNEAARLVAAGRAADVAEEAERTQLVLSNMSEALGRGDMDTFTRIRDSLGPDFAGITPDNFGAAASLAGVSLEGMYEAMDAANPDPADEYGRYVQEETAAGRQPLSRIDYKRAGQKSSRISVDADGNVVVAEGQAAETLPKTTEGEKSASGYLSRMRASETTMEGLGTPENPAVRSIASLLVAGTNFEGLVLSEEQERILQAQRDWVRAKLRKESGAVIGEEEMAEEIRTYFPLPGDGPETIKQKAQARKQAERQFEIMAGNAAPQAVSVGDQSGSGPSGPQQQGIDLTGRDQELFEKYAVPTGR